MYKGSNKSQVYSTRVTFIKKGDFNVTGNTPSMMKSHASPHY